MDVTVTIERVVFSNERGWAILKGELDDGQEITVVGSLSHLHPGETVRFSGDWEDNRRFGRQFAARAAEVTRPATARGLERYLGGIDGVGPATARLLVDALGEEVLDVIREHPERLLEVRGIGETRARAIVAAVCDRDGHADQVAQLRQWDVPPHLVPKILKLYGTAAVEWVRENPYRLITDFHGVGFKTADSIAQGIGVPVTAPERVRAGVLHVLREASGEGHVFLPRARLMSAVTRLLGLTGDHVLPELVELEEVERVVIDGEAVYLSYWHTVESLVAARLRALASAPDTKPPAPEPDPALVGDIELSPRQREAVELARREKVLVITGGPGTGKTTITRVVLAALAQGEQEVVLCAPTGRAAKRLAEATGHPAATIHRTLGYNPEGGWGRTRLNPLSADVVLVDESSMVDVELVYRLLDAVPDGARLVLVGDADQLPSVGPGRVLRDVIESGVVPVVELDQIFRQAARSQIVVNAHRVNAGLDLHVPEKGESADFYLVERDEPTEAADLVVRLATEVLPRKFGFDPRRDVWVMAPMRRGPLGVEALNLRLQDVLNPSGEPFGDHGLRVGDRVMQHRNNYDIDVFNGDVGRVESFDPEQDEAVVVLEDNRRVGYDKKARRDLQLAYATTVHKAQGSEFPCAVMVVHTTHFIMLQRTLLYTGMTRARRLLVVVGNQAGVARAIENSEAGERHSGLTWRLRETGAPPAREPVDAADPFGLES